MEDNSLLGCNTSTSVEIPYSSLTFKRGVNKKPSKVKTKVEVWAFSNSRIVGNGTRYTDVGMYESYTSFSSKRKISSLFCQGGNLWLYLTSILYCRGCLRVYKHQQHFVSEVCKDFAVLALLSGLRVICVTNICMYVSIYICLQVIKAISKVEDY